jgi:hypothetical protein
MSTGNGVVSENELMMKLVQSKKIMNKVENNDFERGHVNESILTSSPEELVQHQNFNLPSKRPVGTPSVEKIQNSKLPDVVKRAMIENPIPQITLNDGIDMELVKGAKKLMEREGMITKKPTQKENVNFGSVDMSSISILIENTIRKVLDEKLNQILTAQQTTMINENLVLKVGDSIFKGKITGVNKSK